MQVQWLWRKSPARLDHPDSFFTYDWSDKDKASWLADDPANRQAQDRLDSLMAEIAGHPDTESYRAAVNSEQIGEQLAELSAAFGAQIAAHRDVIAACFADHRP